MKRNYVAFLRNISLLTGFIILSQTTLFGQQNFSDQTIDIGVIVSDLDASLEFYQEVIGMQAARSFDVDEGFAESSGLSNGVSFHVEVLQLGTKNTATEYKLMTFGERSESLKDEFIYEHTGPQYITIMVDNLTPVYNRIQEHDVKPLGETPISLNEQDSFILIQDPDGVFIELIGPMK